MAIEDLRDDDLKTIGKSDADPLVKDTYRRLARYKSPKARQDWIKLVKECWDAAVENEFFTDKEKAAMREMGQEPVSYNKLNKGVQGSSAIVTDSKPGINFLPIGSGDLYVAELLKRAHDVVWAKNDGNDLVYSVVEQVKIAAQGFIEARHDASKGPYGRLVMEECEPTIYFWSNSSRARDLSDTDIIKAQLRTKKYIKAHYDDIADSDLKFDAVIEDGPTGADRTDTVEGEDNYAINPDKSDSDGYESKSDLKNIWEIEAWILKVEKEDWAIIKYKNEKSPRPAKIELKKGQKLADVIAEIDSRPEVEFAEHWPRRVQNRYLRVIVGKKLILQTVTEDDGTKKEVKERLNPYGLDSDGDPVLPIITLRGQRTRSAYCKSPTYFAMGPNKHLCKRHAQFTYAATMGLSAPIIKPKGMKWTKGEPGTPGSEAELSANAPFQPYRLAAERVDLSSLSFLIEKDEQFIDDQYDLQDVMRGKPPKGQEQASGRFVLALQDLAGMMSKPFLRALESMIVRLAKVNIAIVLQNWQRYMWERLLEDDEWESFRPDEEDNQDEMAQPGTQEDQERKEKTRQMWEDALEKIRPLDPAEPPGISLIDLDVSVTAGSSLPTNRMARLQVAQELYGVGLYDRKAALKYADDPEADAISERMDARDAQAAAAGVKK